MTIEVFPPCWHRRENLAFASLLFVLRSKVFRSVFSWRPLILSKRRARGVKLVSSEVDDPPSYIAHLHLLTSIRSRLSSLSLSLSSTAQCNGCEPTPEPRCERMVTSGIQFRLFRKLDRNSKRIEGEEGKPTECLSLLPSVRSIDRPTVPPIVRDRRCGKAESATPRRSAIWSSMLSEVEFSAKTAFQRAVEREVAVYS